MIRLGSFALVVVACLGFGAGCRQGVGDRCQVTGDCQSDLICVIPPGQTAVTGGKCQTQNSADASSFQNDDQLAPEEFSTPGDDASTL